MSSGRSSPTSAWAPRAVETLQVFFDSGENMRETARRLHLANRTVAYRLERIEALLGHPLDGELGRRLAVALMVMRLHSVYRTGVPGSD